MKETDKIEFEEDGTIKQWWDDDEEGSLEVRWMNEAILQAELAEENKELNEDSYSEPSEKFKMNRAKDEIICKEMRQMRADGYSEYEIYQHRLKRDKELGIVH